MLGCDVGWADGLDVGSERGCDVGDEDGYRKLIVGTADGALEGAENG